MIEPRRLRWLLVAAGMVEGFAVVATAIHAPYLLPAPLAGLGLIIFVWRFMLPRFPR